MSSETVSDERLAKMPEVADGVLIEMKAEVLKSIITELLTLRSKPVAGVEVKPLEWEENSHTSVWTGELAFGVYYVAWDEGMGWRAFRKQFLSEAFEVEIEYGDKATVLAAAESDYRNRIMSAITYSVEHVASGQSYDAISKVVHECRNRQRQTGESDQMLSRWITEALSALLPKATAPVVGEPVAGSGDLEARIFNTLVHDYPAPYTKVDALSKKLAHLYAFPPPQPMAVTEEMVDRAHAVIWPATEWNDGEYACREFVRTALEAALKEA